MAHVAVRQHFQNQIITLSVLRSIFHPIKSLLILLLSICGSLAAGAFSPETYPGRSVLADGHWVSISVDASGPVLLTPANLARWGFGDPSRIRVFGSGGRRISDHLSADNFACDLPQVPAALTPAGVVFYAAGPEEWSGSAARRFTHTLNPFSTVARYFITDRDDIPPLEPAASGMSSGPAEPVTTFTERVFHELDQTSPGESGYMLVGEDISRSERSFSFPLPGAMKGTEGWIQLRAVTDLAAPARLHLTAAGTPLTGTDGVRIGATASTAYATLTTASGVFPLPDSKTVEVKVSLTPEGQVRSANIDCIDLNYTRRLSMADTGGLLEFTAGGSECALDGISPGLTIWDVTDPLHITRVDYQTEGSRARWKSSFGPERRYLAWAGTSGMTVPTDARPVSNSNLPYLCEVSPEMVILTPAAWKQQAERIAGIHRSATATPLATEVVDVGQIYNEFGSGIPDIGALRRFLKMLYDNGERSGRPLRYALLLGDATFDNRGMTRFADAPEEITLPTWQTDESLRKYDSFASDDILAMLDDDSGLRMGSDRHCIAVGRIPASNLDELRGYVDKLERYTADRGDASGREWKNRVLLVADDGNAGKHIIQTETMAANMLATAGGRRMFYTKAYVDAFDIVGGTCTGARERMMRSLDNGTMWWSFTGHAGINFLTGDNILTYGDVTTLAPARLPVFFGATCSFARYDGSQRSGSEIMVLNPAGGVIAAISATREVFIDENGLFSAAIGHEAFAPGSDGMLPTLGEAFMRAKNRLASPAGQSNENKLRYILLGDPALRYAMPDATIRIDSINGMAAADSIEVRPEIQAGGTAVITGTVLSPRGKPLSDFSGTVSSTLYDAEHSVTTSGRMTALDGEGEKITFEEQGEMLFTGRDSVSAGRFTLRIPMPADIADNYRPAALTTYARSSSGMEAAGCDRSFYVFGHDDTAGTDTVAPSIDYMYLNHETFTDGSAVNPDPMLIAGVSDNVSLNLSSAGIGNMMVLTLDPGTRGSRTFNDVARHYLPSPDGSPAGMIRYPLQGLEEGPHTVELKVWDTAGNTARQSLAFTVDERISPEVFAVWTDANPASSYTNFYLSHNRPDALLAVTIAVYDLAGHLVWTSTVTDRSDMFSTAPVRWDLRDMGGRRVARGIYIYRATVSQPGATTAPRSIAGKIAVTAR